MSESVTTLFNPLEEDFTFRWDKVPYTITGKTSMHFPTFLAQHGAKHLVDYILLRPQFWEALGIKRADKGDIRNSEGQVVNEPNWLKGRDEVLKLVLGVEQKSEIEKPKTENEKIKEKVEKLNIKT